MRIKPDLNDVFGPGGLRVLFQPIFEIVDDNIHIFALECLSRGPRGSVIEKADALFRFVRSQRQEAAIDRYCIENALREAAKLPHSVQMHINIHASTIASDEELVDFISWSARAHEIDLPRLVFEIIDDTSSISWKLTEGLRALRSAGMGLAVDGIGTGPSGRQMLVECKPDYFKIDRLFIEDIHRDQVRRAVVRSTVQLAAEVGGRLVAEGVEIGPELATIRGLGINLVQGFLLAPPREGSSFSANDLEQSHPVTEVA